ncbi:hypothetical protein BD309DRAFT_975051 [Dichomitus squalens]|nr:hypothetical protein BD309DRAFT_975051 [Dichomitus squalens]
MAGERRTQSMVLLAGGIAPAAAGLRPHVGLGWPKGDPGSWKAKEKVRTLPYTLSTSPPACMIVSFPADVAVWRCCQDMPA